MTIDGDARAAGGRPVERTAIYRLAMFGVVRRRVVILLWVAAFLVAAPFVPSLASKLSSGGFEVPGSQSDRVARAVETEFEGRSTLSSLVVLRSERLTARDAAFRQAIARVRERVATAPGVATVADPFAAPQQFISADGRVVTIPLGLSDDQNQALRHAPDVEAAVEEAVGEGPVDGLVTGGPSFYREFQDTTTHDLERAERIALPISLLILVLAFGSLVAAGMPLILSLIGLTLSFGLIALLAAFTGVSVFAQNIASMIGIGVGIDYSLFILARYRQELREGLSVGEAVAEAVATSGKAVLVSALTVVVALSGTLLVDIQAFRTMGIAAMIAVAVAGAAALLLLPALLGWVGRRIDKFSIHRRRSREGRMWHRWAMAVMRRPWLALAASLLIVGLLAWPARNLRLGSSGPSILPPDAEPRVAAEITAEAFGEGQVSPAEVLLTVPEGILTPTGLRTVGALSASIAEDPEVVRVDSLASYLPPGAAAPGSPVPRAARQLLAPFVSRDGQSTLLRVVTERGPQSQEVHDLVERLREQLPGIVPAGVDVAVGGDPGLDVDLTQEVGDKLVPVVGLVLVLSFLVLMMFFRSLLLPLKAILMNLGSVLAAYGLLVFVFQYGHGESLLGFVAPGHIEAFLPLFLFTILFGLSMDYEVFLLARIREEYLRTGDNTEAVGWGLERTARLITSAAAIMVTVFGAFAFASLVPIKAMGFGLAVAVFLDATLIRVVLVPSTMRLMGRWNWWLPGWLDRLLPDVSIEGSSPRAAPGEMREPAGARSARS